MTDPWKVPDAPGPSKYHIASPTPRCTGDFAKQCRICMGLPLATTIHPVEVYRYWDTYFSKIYEYRHRATPWLLVEPFLRSHGYKLKKMRHRKGFREDHADLLWFVDRRDAPYSSHTYPAFDKTGRSVYIKMVPPHLAKSQEYAVLRLLNSEKMRLDPRNHTVPVRKVLFFTPDFAAAGFTPTPSDMRVFIIMEDFPRLSQPAVGDPRLVCPLIASFDDLLALAVDVLQCLQFLHFHGIAHRDLTLSNTVYNTHRRHWVLIDFQMSRHFPKPWSEPPRVLRISARREPEGSSGIPYDPFIADAYNAGTVLRSAYACGHLKGKGNTFGLSEVWDGLLEEKPEHRMSIEDALRKVEAIKRLRSPAVPVIPQEVVATKRPVTSCLTSELIYPCLLFAPLAVGLYFELRRRWR